LCQEAPRILRCIKTCTEAVWSLLSTTLSGSTSHLKVH